MTHLIKPREDPDRPPIEYVHRVTFLAKPDNIITVITAYGPEKLAIEPGDIIQTRIYQKHLGRQALVVGTVLNTERGDKIQ